MKTQINRFDFLRLLFAGAVAVYHAVVLSRIAPRSGWEEGLAQAAEISIQGFFIISGMLVLGSLVRSERLGLYAGKRIRRLYPAYAVVILIPAIISLILTQDFGGVLSYVIPNLAFLNFLEPTLPGLFDNYEGIVNGALWTLKIEVMFYIALPVIWWFIKKPGKLCMLVWIAMFLGAEIWRQFFLHFDHAYSDQLARQLPGQMGYFAIGMLVNQNWHKLQNPKLWWAGLGVVLVGLTLWLPILHILRPVGLALIIIWIANAPGPRLNSARYGDMSYGVYITHFPIIQACIAAGLFATPAIGLIASFGLTIIASFALWHLVEKRALLPSSHYRRAS
ncbi:MAG: acyltransferase [Hellea sp.]|nr:acyltransferase [Hellea sp.]